MKLSKSIKRAAIPRAGYDYQDLAGIEILIRHYRDPDLYDWVMLEADDSAYRALDDVVAARKDGSFELIQVKFTVDSERYELDWAWLLEKTGNGTSLLAKWSASLARVKDMGPVHCAGLKTNRSPSLSFTKCLKGTRVDFNLIPVETRNKVMDECGGKEATEAFLETFDFVGGMMDPAEFESSLRDQLVPSDTDMLGWLVLQSCVRRWATFKNQPGPDGRIQRDHVLHIITKKRPQPIRQDFLVPEGYAAPSDKFDSAFRSRIADDANPITILWGTPGRGKSTYLSYLTKDLQEKGAAITRHHYFLASEDSASNRTSFIEISTSLMAQLYAHHPEAMVGVSDDFSQLRTAMATAAKNLKEKSQRLYIVVDGLDHVWRDIGHVQQLDHLFNELLPLPPNISLIIGTQKVADEQLPRRLLTTARASDWIEIPPMDEVAVHRWVIQQDKSQPLMLRYASQPAQRNEMMVKIAAVFFRISKGHPLHLIYVYQSLVHAGSPTSAEEIEQLPDCPGGDIRDYYQGLWVRLGSSAKNALHMLAGSDFFWPGIGVRQVLGTYNEIEFLLEPRNIGLVPFHASIFAWVRERDDHPESYEALLPKIIDWLANYAPEYWRWGWLWLLRAQAGSYENLLTGATSEWVVKSLAKGWPVQQIENILRAAERKTFHDGDYPRTVTIRSLKTRVKNAKKFQSQDFSSFRATSLAISQNQQQTLNLLDEIFVLDDSEVLELARKGPEEAADEIVSTCFEELARRVNAWVHLRHRPQQEFSTLSDQLLSIASLMNVDIVKRTLTYIRRFSEPEPKVILFIKLLANAQNIEGLQFVQRALRGIKWSAQRRLISDNLIRICGWQGADANELLQSKAKYFSPFAACWLIWRDRESKPTAHTQPVSTDFLKERYSPTKNDEIEEFYINSFWSMLYTSLVADGDFEIVHLGLNYSEPGWIIEGLNNLELAAHYIANGEADLSFSTIFVIADDIEPAEWGSSSELEHAQYRAFRNALNSIAVDIHILSRTDTDSIKISIEELIQARKSSHWLDLPWIIRTVESRTPIFDEKSAALLLDDQAKQLLTTVTEFGERGDRWATLADMARLSGSNRTEEFITHAAECLIGYGYHKDLYAMEVLDSVQYLANSDLGAAQTHLKMMAPIVDKISDFTDGDETRHVRSTFIEVLAKLSPDRLPHLYEHHLSRDEYSYADECLIQFGRILDLNTSEGSALTRTFLDEGTLHVLEKRANGDAAARAVLAVQNSFLGRQSREPEKICPPAVELSASENEAAKIDPTSFKAGEFEKLVDAATEIHYQNRDQFTLTWLLHWKSKKQGKKALASIRKYIDTNKRSFNIDHILDDAFQVSLEVEGKDAAYSWLVKAHIHRNGWQSYWTSEEQIMGRLKISARFYADRWEEYIRDTSLPAPYYNRNNGDFVIGYKYLVSFLMLVGQSDKAAKIVQSFINTLIDEVREQPIPEAVWYK
ncbi:NACHT domain-containing protein [Pseudomonas fluorescens]|uniref:ATP-binding protein n=1 Tax=Pseudomonas fluorescens TaxID=294 RepID=UPI001785FD6D|nr:ATP-binding protein [Pseudomonas fluorescens]MBD8194224.1 NACHT domain-containing protein [Pseudomonas fluorescens]MBD8228967.1 NACHT domain-containing protein [Pseudomonas fluorescens]MBD8787034.1 NACHT domain-containing protein [Pseudomonas fluorescens]MBD8819132.1 NACHT domain-containing protein [Pseudomonas fluorescens]